MSTEFLVWITALAALEMLYLVLRGEKLLRWKVVTRFIIAFLLACAALLVFPAEIPAKYLRYPAAFIVLFTAAFILYSLLAELIGKIKNTVSSNSFGKEAPSYVSELCRAMAALTTRKLGGLVVIERKDNLGNLMGGGVAFDAEIRAEIVVALFEKNSSVHDGAMIIREGRVAKVKAILPHNLDASLPLSMGTRHRSAIGITEKSDAIALVASEERGEFGVAYRGSFVKPASYKELVKTVDRALARKRI
jgi:DNA integrity scanning protein DisA with diadenylate cyclase activity